MHSDPILRLSAFVFRFVPDAVHCVQASRESRRGCGDAAEKNDDIRRVIYAVDREKPTVSSEHLLACW